MAPSDRLPPHLRPVPSRVYVEVTSRCNLRCPMCVKQADGCAIGDGDLTSGLFEAVLPALDGVESLVLNGIGEPLLHPRLEEFIRRGRETLPDSGRIAFQTNGLLLTEARLRELVAAGLDTISFSLDALDSSAVDDLPGGPGPDIPEELRSGTALDSALALCRRVKPGARPGFRVGIEFVLQRDTAAELPAVVRWAAERGVDFILVTHLLAYDESMSSRAVFDRATDRALDHYREWGERAAREGLDLDDYYPVLWKYTKNAEEQRLVDFVAGMVDAAREKDIFLDLKVLQNRDESLQEAMRELFEEARAAAALAGVELSLPSLTPRFERRCDFIEEGSIFIDRRGDLYPCYFLWHSYACHVTGWRKYVTARSFGNLGEADLLEIWNGDAFRGFREEVMRYDYPFCTNCTLAPCDYIDSPTFEQDCFTNTIPCGDCQWCLGLFQCLR